MTQPLAVVLVRPTEEGNVGAAARAMANMGLERLILVEPAVTIGEVARARAVGAGHLLDGTERAPDLARALAPFRRVVGTTSARERADAAPRITARELPGVLAADPPGTPTALVFGPERSGLTTEELARCSPLVTIPTRPVQPTLNLAQAVLVVAYELALAETSGEGADAPEPATWEEVEGLFAHLERVLPEIGFARDDTFAATLRDLRRLAGRAGLTSREVRVLRGICRRTVGTVERLRSDG
ncbi:MAG: RNA methyltransferase [Thermoanaerobaculia bacterium]|nr:RNA methyltransferase [Thermoanaerobaculia bacterium]